MGEGIVGWLAVERVFPYLLAATLGLFVLAATPATVRAETRTLKLYFAHTGEKQTFTYKRRGRFVRSELKRMNEFLRDWRRDEATTIDPTLFDILWEIYEASGAKEEIHVVSAYRSQKTNNMLRRRGRGVAKQSQHIQGKAIDFFIPGVPLSTLRKLALRRHGGGVGYYPKSGSPFVHVDTGSIRHWPRMSRQQLADVFPNGRTVHVPRDGKPLEGYKIAMAALRSDRTTLATLDADTGSIRPTGRPDPDIPNPAPRSTILAAAVATNGLGERLPHPRPDSGAIMVLAALPSDAERKALDLLYAKLEAASDSDAPRPRPAVYRDDDEAGSIASEDRVALAYAAAGLSDDLVPRDKLDAVAAVNALSKDRIPGEAADAATEDSDDPYEAVTTTFSPQSLPPRVDPERTALLVRPVLDPSSLRHLSGAGLIEDAAFARLARPAPDGAATLYAADLKRPRGQP